MYAVIFGMQLIEQPSPGAIVIGPVGPAFEPHRRGRPRRSRLAGTATENVSLGSLGRIDSGQSAVAAQSTHFDHGWEWWVVLTRRQESYAT